MNMLLLFANCDSNIITHLFKAVNFVVSPLLNLSCVKLYEYLLAAADDRTDMPSNVCPPAIRQLNIIPLNMK